MIYLLYILSIILISYITFKKGMNRGIFIGRSQILSEDIARIEKVQYSDIEYHREIEFYLPLLDRELLSIEEMEV